jgi:hypothetical protein
MTIQTPVYVSTSPDDGQGDKLRDAFIKINERFQDIAALFQNKGNWTTGTQYEPRDYILEGGEAYVCVIGHTAGTFATDLAAGKWASVDALDLRADLASTTMGKGAALVAFEGGGNVQDLKESQGSSLVGFLQAGSGAVQRTAQDKMREWVSVKDFGAVGDGVANDRAAINLALAYLESVGGGTLYFPFGTYYISDTIGNQTNPAGKISLQLLGDPGTVINCNPAVYSNGAVVLQYAKIDTAIVKNLIVRCNTKTARGITISATDASDSIRVAQVDSCQVYDVHAVNNAGVTSNLHAIAISSTGWGFDASITNCVIENVTRAKTGLACQAIIVAGMQNALVQNNSVSNVRHSGVVGDKQDADGVVVFSKQNGSGNYEKSTATVTNNTIRNCEGRFVKLQTNGSAVVQNNLMTIDGAIELIDDWVGVDSQVGDATICDNTAKIGTGWTGGGSAIMFQAQPPLAANTDYANEGFFNRVNRNNVEVRQSMPYFCIPSMPPSGCTANHYVEVCDNFVNNPVARGAVSAVVAFSHFIYLSSGPTPANTAGTVTWKINGNQATTYDFISLTYALGDYTNKWFFFVYDNYKASFGGDGRSVFAGSPYTSTMMVRDNQMGPAPGRMNWPIDFSKVFDGTDFYSGGQVMTNVPVSYTFSRCYKRGGHWGVQNNTVIYISPNATSWTAK